MLKKAILCMSVLLPLVAASLPAEACLTRILKAPPAIEAYLGYPPEKQDDELARLAEAFQRDKLYYDALVLEFCTLTMHSDNEAHAYRANIDSKIIALLAEKWMPTPVLGKP